MHKIIHQISFVTNTAIISLMTCLIAGAETHYVVPTGTPGANPVPNYTNWAEAATNIQDAANVATHGDVVLVTNGNYTSTNEITAPLQYASDSITIRSVNGRDFTSVNGQGTHRCFLITNCTVLDGFTITNGYASSGGGCYIECGKVYNCLIANNRSTISGGGIYAHATGGGAPLITNCIIRGNICTNDGTTYCLGGGAHIDNVGVTMVGCKIYGNLLSNLNNSSYGGGIVASWFSVISNCVIYGNSSYGNNSDNSAAYINGGSRAYNCLVFSNTVIAGSAVYSRCPDGANNYIQNLTIVDNNCLGLNLMAVAPYTNYVQNTISYFNTGAISNLSISGPAVISNCCFAPTSAAASATAAGLNIESNPLFVDTGNQNYRLQANSPCINAGQNQDWMTNSVDLDGRTRIRYGTVDMGAYEWICNGTVYTFR